MAYYIKVELCSFFSLKFSLASTYLVVCCGVLESLVSSLMVWLYPLKIRALRSSLVVWLYPSDPLAYWFQFDYLKVT